MITLDPYIACGTHGHAAAGGFDLQFIGADRFHEIESHICWSLDIVYSSIQINDRNIYDVFQVGEDAKLLGF